MSIEPNKRTFFNNDNLGAMLSSGDCSGKPGVEEAKVVNAKKRLRLSIC